MVGELGTARDGKGRGREGRDDALRQRGRRARREKKGD